MVDETTYNELDRYFTGRMQGEERVAFESRLSADANLKTELDWIVNATTAMKNSGRAVMKQHIAAAIAGVPVKDLQKYSPSKNAKPFWKKWWAVIVAVAVAVAVSGAVVYANVWVDEGGEYHFFDAPLENNYHPQEEEHSVVKEHLQNDSCSDTMSLPETETDSVKTNEASNLRENTEVYYELDGDRLTEIPKVGRDSAHRIVWTNGYDVAPVTISGGAGGERKKPMGVIVGIQKNPPYTYILEEDLTLNSPYTSTAGFTFKESGDTVYMTDKEGVKYMLLRNRGVQPLVPLKVGANK